VATGCHSQFGFGFQPKITAAFDGGEITTDAGLLLVREFDDRLGLTAALRTAVPDPRDRRYVTHDVLTLLRQRIYQIAVGYEDANDATYLRHDPTLQAVTARLGTPLASQPTLSRLENAAPWDTIRRLGRVLRQWFTRHAVARDQPPVELILDVDSTDDPTHGQQYLSFFNGHYDEHMYHPLLVFADGYLLGARLRAGNVGGATQLQPLLAPIVAHLRATLPATALALRADGAFCNPALRTTPSRPGSPTPSACPRIPGWKRASRSIASRPRSATSAPGTRCGGLRVCATRPVPGAGRGACSP